MSNFRIFFPAYQKNLLRSGQEVPRSKIGQPLIYCGSKVWSGQVRAHLFNILQKEVACHQWFFYKVNNHIAPNNWNEKSILRSIFVKVVLRDEWYMWVQMSKPRDNFPNKENNQYWTVYWLNVSPLGEIWNSYVNNKVHQWNDILIISMLNFQQKYYTNFLDVPWSNVIYLQNKAKRICV